MTVPLSGNVGPQRLYQQTSQALSNPSGSMATNFGFVTLTFPSVPQGSVWTGTIQASSDQDEGQVLAAANWTLLRNGQAYLSWTGYGQAVNVQGTGQDVFVLEGNNIGPIDQGILVTAQWLGRSDDAATAPLLWPYVTASPSIVAVTPFDPTAGLLVQDNGWPVPVIPVSKFQVPKNTTLFVVGVSVGDHLRLWHANISCYCGGAAGGELVCQLQDSTNGASLNYLQVGTFSVAGNTNSQGLSMDLGGVHIPTGASLNVVTTNSTATIATSYITVYVTAESGPA